MYSPIAIVKSEEYAYPKIKELFDQMNVIQNISLMTYQRIILFIK